jgi:heme O synthase-like polyprenyltransferase
LVLAKVSDKSGYLVGTALGGPHAGMVIGGVVAKYTDNKWAGAALGATMGATVYGGAFALGSGLSKRHTIAGVITGGVLGAVSGYAANTSGW